VINAAARRPSRSGYFLDVLVAAAFWRFFRAFHFWRRMLFTRMCLLFEFAIPLLLI
jgi:hypothetical protein